MADPRKEFIKAAKAGDRAKLRALLASDESLLGVRDADGSTATDLQGRTPLNHTEFHKAKAAAKILAVCGAA